MSAASGARARPDTLELVTGMLVMGVLIALVVLAMAGRHHKGGDGYPLRAVFSQIDGLDVGADVRLAGITIGHVTSETVDPKDFRARVIFTVRKDVSLPDDSAAIVTSDSLLGGKYIALSPGGSDAMLKPGAVMVQTQGSISLEQLLSKFIFSVTDNLPKSKGTAPKAGDAGP
ncbi:outer membrane lipid asymmetry maintenance protein MlaD [Neoasaia chiangmaiensis]|uniref:Outer membrane lipid asymmetry maintenance protein MlaD n=1 Tax=Neoasaia chiangmaiensis TaxID=320497 RepID=A0A1U9KUF3_9PROT|nr:outer membrane lipid asymmetry maintenance protein MlaD [Neoasaia chiangmaiensis]AQS89451.1 outer membrane lipid asymmetry maintenance protein MlaD [Neoasaia chiangmaiensis]